ncbi:MAG: hypothetical protein V2A53_00385 [bacterium]
MIISRVYPYLIIELLEGQIVEKAYVDTGFEGFLFLPEEYEKILGKGDAPMRLTLAGNKIEWGSVYYNRKVKVYGIQKDGSKDNGMEKRGEIICYGKGSYLIGRKFLDEFRVYLDKNIEMTIMP